MPTATSAPIPRPEHPRPQFERADWINLNGPWTFALDPGRSGGEAGWAESHGFDGAITVPFCPESVLSGVGHTDFIEAMWYHRTIAIPEAWGGRRVMLHFGAVEWESEVFVDGRSVGVHYGGACSFAHDITAFVRPGGGEHHLVVRVRDDLRSGNQPGGKQSPQMRSHGCLYTRTTGIWQTVWLEAVAAAGLADCQIVPDLDGGRFILTPSYLSVARGGRLRVRLRACHETGSWPVAQSPPAVDSPTDELAAPGSTAGGDCATISEAEVAQADGVPVVLAIPETIPARPWSPSNPHLYGLELEVLSADGSVVDRVQSYAGLRKIHVEGNRFFLNNEPLFQRLVLDQGFYPDGIWTAPSDAALRRDIELSMAAGFNGARLHQKVFEERFHYWADRLGYLTWGETPSWGLGLWRVGGEAANEPGNPAQAAWNFLAEWREIVRRDRNHPSIVAWTPFNETRSGGARARLARIHTEAWRIAHLLDPTRPVNDASGYTHVRTDLWTVHTYDQNPESLRKLLAPDPEKGPWRNYPDEDAPYGGQPYIVDEFGGIQWVPADRRAWAGGSWGYGNAPKTEEEFYARLEGLVDTILSHEHIVGYCYTQLTDVEQEQNGVYNYDRSAKFDTARIAAIFGKAKG